MYIPDGIDSEARDPTDNEGRRSKGVVLGVEERWERTGMEEVVADVEEEGLQKMGAGEVVVERTVVMEVVVGMERAV